MDRFFSLNNLNDKDNRNRIDIFIRTEGRIEIHHLMTLPSSISKQITSNKEEVFCGFHCNS